MLGLLSSWQICQSVAFLYAFIIHSSFSITQTYLIKPILLDRPKSEPRYVSLINLDAHRPIILVEMHISLKFICQNRPCWQLIHKSQAYAMLADKVHIGLRLHSERCSNNVRYWYFVHAYSRPNQVTSLTMSHLGKGKARKEGGVQNNIERNLYILI